MYCFQVSLITLRTVSASSVLPNVMEQKKAVATIPQINLSSCNGG